MGMNINGAILNSEVVLAIRNIQECKDIYPGIIDNQMNLLISQRGNIQESSDQIMERLEDLNLLKGMITAICNITEDERNGKTNP